MERRTKIIIVVAVVFVVFVIALVALAPLIKKSGVGENANNTNIFTNTNTTKSEFIENKNIQTDTREEVLTKEPSTQSVLIAIAKTFAEKFGSFSNQGNFENLQDAKYFMTTRMVDWTNQYIEKNKKVQNTAFYGVTTKSLKEEIITLSDDEESAQVLVSTQQEEFGSQVASRGKIVYKRLMLDFKKVDNSWKVDSAQWQ